VAAGGFGFDIVLEPEVKEKVYLAPGKSWYVRKEMIKIFNFGPLACVSTRPIVIHNHWGLKE
jgi:hypothetical protein